MRSFCVFFVLVSFSFWTNSQVADDLMLMWCRCDGIVKYNFPNVLPFTIYPSEYACGSSLAIINLLLSIYLGIRRKQIETKHHKTVYLFYVK